MADRGAGRVLLSGRPLSEYEPGQRVRHPGAPEWGVGQVQSAVGDRVTVNFEHAGKVLVHVAAVRLLILDAEESGDG